MCVPLREPATSGKAFGVIQLDTQDRFKKFTQDDLKLLLSVAGQAAVALENARMHESLVARAGLERDLQTGPPGADELLAEEVAAGSTATSSAPTTSRPRRSAAITTISSRCPSGRIGVMIGDVAGKGVPAALLMAKVSSDARFCILTERDAGRGDHRLNELMQEAGLLDRFVTLGACLLDPATHEVTFVNAGHVPPLVYRKATDTFEEPVTTRHDRLPARRRRRASLRDRRTFRLEPGDSVLLFTDGVTEAKNQEEHEFQMAASCDRPAGRADGADSDGRAPRRRRQAARAGCKPHDDITVVAFGRQG